MESSSNELPIHLPIDSEVDTAWCRRRASSLMSALGFREKAVWEVSIALSELATNVLKFAGKGALHLRPLDAPLAGIEVIVEDDGPGIPDIEKAIADGFSEGGFVTEAPLGEKHSLGSGLGAVRRLMDDVRIENKPLGGLRIRAIKILKQH